MVDYTDYITQGAIKRGLDPRMALHVVDTEGGRSGKTGDSGTSFGPFQMHVAGTAPGTTAAGLGNEMLAHGLNPKDPYQGIDYALDYAAKHGFQPSIWHGLYGDGLRPGESRWVGEPSYEGGALHLGRLEKAPGDEQAFGMMLLDDMLTKSHQEQQTQGNTLLDNLVSQTAQTLPAGPMVGPIAGNEPGMQPSPEIPTQQPNIAQPFLSSRATPQPQTQMAAAPQAAPAAAPQIPPYRQAGTFEPFVARGGAILDNILKSINPIGTAHAEENIPSVPQRQPPPSPPPPPPQPADQQQQAPQAQGDDTLDFILKGLNPEIGDVSNALPVVKQRVESALQPFQPPAGGPDVTTREGFRQAALNTDQATNVALSFGPSNIVNSAASAVRGLFSTRTAADRAATKTARSTVQESTGVGRQRKAQEGAAVEKLWKTVSPYVQEYQRWIDAVHAGQMPPLPVIQELNNYMQGIGKLSAQSQHLAPVAKAIRDAYNRVLNDILTEVPNLKGLEDYVRQMWVETKMSGRTALPQRVTGSGKQGSGASLKQQVIPSIQEGIEAGYTPTFLNPIENMLHYVTGMEDFLAWNRAYRIGEASGHIMTKPAPGLVALNGRLGGYALPGYAKIWNNYIGKGWRADPTVGNIYDKVLHFTNSVTMAKLALSGYHAWNIAQETLASGLADALGKFRAGDVTGALKEMGYSVTVVPKLGKQLVKGKRLQQAYLGMSNTGSNFDRHLANLYAHGGGRATGRGAEYSTMGQEHNFWRAWKRGALGYEMRAGLRGILGRGGPMGEAMGTRTVLAPFRAIGFAGNQIGRLMSTVTAPLFDTMIPRIKFAAWADEMETYLNANPGASFEDQVAHSQLLVNAMDDRFGEMIQDNLFWNPMLKQSLNTMATSVGWEYGTLRAFGSAVKDISQGKVFSPRARWLYSFPTIMGLSAAVYQYLKTGKRPEGPLDYVMPQSGGKTPEGKPERSLLPGPQKEPLDWYRDFFRQGDITKPNPYGLLTYAEGKLNPASQLVGQVATQKNWLGQPISNAQQFTPQWFKDYARQVFQGYEPIPIQQEKLRNTNIGTAERVAGVRPAPAYIEDPMRDDRMQTMSRVRALQSKLRGLYAHGARTTGDRESLRQQGEEIRQGIVDELRGLAERNAAAQKKLKK